jgi:hypothetical protein
MLGYGFNDDDGRDVVSNNDGSKPFRSVMGRYIAVDGEHLPANPRLNHQMQCKGS